MIRAIIRVNTENCTFNLRFSNLVYLCCFMSADLEQHFVKMTENTSFFFPQQAFLFLKEI